MDQQVPIEDLYRLADRYARGDKLPEWVEGFLAEELPGSLLSDLKAKRRKVLRQRIFTDSGKTFEFPREDSANFGAEQPKPKRKTGRKKWTPEDPVVQELARAYVNGLVMTRVNKRLGVNQHLPILRSVYDRELVSKMREVRWALQRVAQQSLAVEWGWNGNPPGHEGAGGFLLHSLVSEGLILRRARAPSAVAGDG